MRLLTISSTRTTSLLHLNLTLLQLTALRWHLKVLLSPTANQPILNKMIFLDKLLLVTFRLTNLITTTLLTLNFLAKDLTLLKFPSSISTPKELL
jgi:hypothetical protein